MRGVAKVSPVDTPGVHEGCHSVNPVICNFVKESRKNSDPPIPQTRQTPHVRLHLCSFFRIGGKPESRRRQRFDFSEERISGSWRLCVEGVLLGRQTCRSGRTVQRFCYFLNRRQSIPRCRTL